jgi:adenosylmethionine-8-amino-7-oxononanoate aminotransferase
VRLGVKSSTALGGSLSTRAKRLSTSLRRLAVERLRLERKGFMDSFEERAALLASAAQDYWPPVHFPMGDMSRETGVRMMVRGEGPWLVDDRGARFLDATSSWFVSNIGHGRKAVASAVAEQLSLMAYTPPSTVSPRTLSLVAKLATINPLSNGRIFLTSGGSEAVETALKVAKQFQHASGQGTRYKVISRQGSLHGATYACMSLGSNSGRGVGAPTEFGPLMPGCANIPGPDNFRCKYCVDDALHDVNETCSISYARELRRCIAYEGADTVACFIAEPISLSSGWHIPSPAYWREIRSICDESGVLLVFDEVLTGFGRTGKMFALEHYDVLPDIMTVAKGMAGGYAPIGACLVSKRVADVFVGSTGAYFHHTFTYGGHSGAAAAALATLAVMEDEGLVDRSARLGQVLFESFLRLKGKYDIVGDVRGGKGLLTVVELVGDRRAKKSFGRDARLGLEVRGALTEHGIIARGGNLLFAAPPLSIDDKELEELVSRYDRVISKLSSRLMH